jgi:hypothetical protein
MKITIDKQKLFLVLAFVGLYCLFTGISWVAFNSVLRPLIAPSVIVSPSPQPEAEKGKFLVDTTGPKTEVCPINGEKYTKAEAQAWEKRRPLLVMIENHEDARPQSGVSRADVVYEAVAEGGITRFMAVYYCDAQAQEVIVGPVRSARTYFLDWASEYGKYPLYAHVGGANTPGPANALGQIEDYGWGGTSGNDMNQFSVGYPTFWRDYERMGRTVLTEHTMYSTTERLWGVAKSRGWTNLSPNGQNWQDNFEPWKFTQDAAAQKRGQVNKIDLEFWANWPVYNVTWQYNSQSNEYSRLNGGQPHKDLDYDQQLAVKNVIVVFTKESSANDGYENNLHLLYGTIGQGKGVYFANGQATNIKWVKKDRVSRTKFYDENTDKEISLVAGKVWIEVLPIGAKLNY